VTNATMSNKYQANLDVIELDRFDEEHAKCDCRNDLHNTIII
jgi:hypothetical protein